MERLRWLAILATAVAALIGVGLVPGGFGTAYAEDPALPVGCHDGVEGTVNAASCSAFGWAVDPDNPDRDVQVRILSDGIPVTTITANLPREDVGACPDGTCGFGAKLWGLISAGEEHQITAQAYDEETSTWVNLSGTPKTVTCWGYPEGFHDGAQGVVDQYGCNANGWAVDPDNRDRDLQVRILADGNPVATTTADLLREDVGACPGGTCGFGVDLWGLISPDEEHQITSQAYDVETEAWLNLEATPKSLTCQSPPPPTPFFRAFPDGNAVDGGNWPLGATVHLAIDDPNTGESPDYQQDATVIESPWDWISTYVRFDLAYDVKRGDVVTLSTDGISRFLIVPDLWVTTVDVATDIVAGTLEALEPGTLVHVFIGGDAQLYVPTDSQGAWVADFGSIGFDLLPGMGGGAEVWFDEFGDSTIFDWYVPNPRFTVFPEWEFFDGLDWPDGATVIITVEGKPECEVAKESWGGFFNGNFGEGCNLEIGDNVTFTDGATTRTHVVRNLAITNVDKIGNTVAGTADLGAVVHAWVHEYGGSELLLTVEDGTWLADFGSIGIDLVENMGGRAAIYDEMGNATAVDWYVPNPRFTVFPEWEFFDGLDWPDGATVIITVEGKPECEVAKESWGGFFNGNFGEGCNLEIGDNVTFTDGATTRTHTVRNLAVTSVDEAADTVAGTADPGVQLQVWAHEQSGPPVDVVAGEDGTWLADLTGVYDIVPGTGGRSQITDEAGNATAVDWSDSDGDGVPDNADSCPLEAPTLGLDADVDGCTDTLGGLIAIVQGLTLDPNIEGGLLGKLEEAQKALERDNTRVALNKLKDFINQVEAQRGKAIGIADADLLVAYANNLIVLLTM